MKKLLEFGNTNLLTLGGIEISISETLLLIFGLIVIAFLSRLTKQIIKRSKRIDKIGERLKVILYRSASYMIWLFGLIILLRLEKVNTAKFFAYKIFEGDKVTITVQKIIILIVVIVIIRLLVLVIDYLMNRKIERDKLDYGKSKSVLQITKYLVWIIGILIGIGAMGLKLTFIIASVSALLVGVGFGLQNIFNDFFSGIIILFDGSIKIKDVVQVGDIVGKVTDIGIRTTKVLNRDNIVLIIPNSKFTTDNVINWSHIDKNSRFAVSVGVAYGSDVELVEKVLLECAVEVKDVTSNPKPFVRFENFGESSLDFKLYFWTSKSFYVENTKSELRFLIDKKFRENGITIPYPQRDLHLITDKTK